MSPALQKLSPEPEWDPNYRIKKQNELGPDMPDTPWWWAPIKEGEKERGRDVHLQCGSAEVIELNMHKMTALIMRRKNGEGRVKRGEERGKI